MIKEFHMVLFGPNIVAFTDHKNLTFHNLMSQHINRWRNFLEEYSTKIIYIEVPLNVVVDTFSCLPCSSSIEGKSTNITNLITGPSVDVESHFFLFHFDDDEMKDCFPNHLPPKMQFYLDCRLIRQNQFDDAQLQLLHQQ
jgi:hypothetical protein